MGDSWAIFSKVSNTKVQKLSSVNDQKHCNLIFLALPSKCVLYPVTCGQCWNTHSTQSFYRRNSLSKLRSIRQSTKSLTLHRSHNGWIWPVRSKVRLNNMNRSWREPFSHLANVYIFSLRPWTCKVTGSTRSDPSSQFNLSSSQLLSCAVSKTFLLSMWYFAWDHKKQDRSH